MFIEKVSYNPPGGKDGLWNIYKYPWLMINKK
jgi:hypothetical protein